MLYVLDYSLSPEMTNNLSRYSVLHLTNSNTLISAFMNDDYTLSSEIYTVQLDTDSEWLAREIHIADHVYGGITPEPPQALKDQPKTIYFYFNTTPPLSDETQREIAVFYGPGLAQSYTRHWNAAGYNPWNSVPPPVYLAHLPVLEARVYDQQTGVLPPAEMNKMDIGVGPSDEAEISFIGSNDIRRKLPISRTQLDDDLTAAHVSTVIPTHFTNIPSLETYITANPSNNGVFILEDCGGISNYTGGVGTVFYDAVSSASSGIMELTIIQHESMMDFDSTDYSLLDGKPVGHENIDSMVGGTHVHSIRFDAVVSALGVDLDGNLTVSNPMGDVVQTFSNDEPLDDSTW
jgi:hypothetical protein